MTPSIGPFSGGMGTVTRALAREQRGQGCDACIWCVDPPGVATAAAIDGLEAAVVGWPCLGPRALAYSPSAERRTAAEPVDVVHQHGVWSAQGRLTGLFRARGIPTLVAPHGSLEPYARRRSAWKKRLALAAFEARNLSEASCLHATAESEVRTFRDFGLRAPVAILPNGVSPSWLQSDGDPERFRRQHHLLHGERLMLYLSRLHPIKGLPLLIDAIAMDRGRVDGWRLIVAGPDEGEHRAEIQSLAEQSGISHLVLFTGPLFDQQKRDAFAAAELFVLPTRSENFGIVIAEALAAGVPVLTTHGAPWGDVQDHRCGWWVPIDARAIAAALADAVAHSPDELHAMGDRGRMLVRSRFVWPAIAERTLLVYRWLLGLAPTPDFVTVN